MPLPSPDEILQGGCKERSLPVLPWVAAQLSDVWQAIQQNILESIVTKGKPGRVQTSPAKPASAHSPT